MNYRRLATKEIHHGEMESIGSRSFSDRLCGRLSRAQQTNLIESGPLTE